MQNEEAFTEEEERGILKDIDTLFRPPYCSNCNFIGCRGETCICASCKKKGKRCRDCTIEDKVRARWRANRPAVPKPKEPSEYELIMNELAVIRDEQKNLRSVLNQILENTEQNKRKAVDIESDEGDGITVATEEAHIDERECVSCRTTKPIKAFQVKETRKSKKDDTLKSYTKTRKTCKACYSEKSRNNKKAKLSSK